MVHRTETGDDGHLGAGDLAVAPLASQLADGLDDVAGADRVGVGEQPAVGVGGQRAARRRWRPLATNSAPSPFLAKPRSSSWRMTDIVKQS